MVKLYINDQEMEYVIEHEKNLGDIVQSIEQEIKNSQGTILSVLLNGKSVPFSSTEWQEVGLPTIETVHIEADMNHITMVKQLRSIMHLLHHVEHCLKSQEKLTKEDCADLRDVISHIDMMCFSSEHEILKTLLEQVFHSVGIFGSGQAYSHIDDALLVLSIVNSIIRYNIHSLQDEELTWMYMSQLVKDSIPMLHNIITYLNTSREFIAVNLLVVYIDIFVLWVYTLSEPPKHIDVHVVSQWKEQHKTHLEGLQSFFDELGAAIEVMDWISVNDLIEYEIIPASESYLAIIAQHFPHKT